MHNSQSRRFEVSADLCKDGAEVCIIPGVVPRLVATVLLLPIESGDELCEEIPKRQGVVNQSGS